MATDVDQAYFSWSQEELNDRNNSQGVSVSQMLDHGSISFGRFEYESLSWEKWSVFTHNRRQEELEKFNGLVAQKKAYFEEYYRRLRALKALQQQQQQQENQQTELTLDYSGDGSISSQNGEDETTSQLEIIRDETQNVTDAEEAISEKHFEREINYTEDPGCRNLDQAFISSGSASLSRNFEKIEQERDSNNVQYSQPLIVKSLKSLKTSKEIEENDGRNLEGEEINRLQLNPNSNLENGAASHQAMLSCTDSISRDDDSKLRLPSKAVAETVKLSSKKTADRKSVPKAPPPPVRSSAYLKQKFRPDSVQSSEKASKPVQKPVAKSDKTNSTAKEATMRVKTTNRATSVTSCRTVKEMQCNNSTTPRPLSAPRERKAGIRETIGKMDFKTAKEPQCNNTSTPRPLSAPRERKTGIRESAAKLDFKTAEGGPNMQVTPKKIPAPSAVKTSRLESKRDYKVVKETSALNRVPTGLKRTEDNVLGTPKSRSINLPPRKKSSHSSGTDQVTENFTRNKQEENKEAKLMQSRWPSRSTTTPSLTGSLRTSTQKAGDLPRFGSKPQIKNPSLNGRKPKVEAPQWR
ncbi:protein WVD2-like 7 isoform X2 [Ananas comosus]|uniref:Protein WVD2-like 7 isoform X2 n=1 Tax=Ananas comosus TaxID=4615 RepID=A0A6P5FBX9_ANACO|nr:protein WVD2-like 7 isoform X2 [Ananas comosus]